MSNTVSDLEKMDMEQLLDLKEKVETRIQTLAADEMEELQEKMKKLAPYVRGSKTGQRKDAGAKAPAKFRDPVSGKTWSGRGMTPVWLREYEEKGRKREEFAL